MIRFALACCAVLSVAVSLTGCGGAAAAAAATTTTTTTTPTTTPNTGLDLTKLPVGDQKFSATTPAVGYIYTCQSSFAGGGATGSTPWINSTANTFDATAKPSVAGSVAWPTHSLSITLMGAGRYVTTNDLPNHNTGVFPIAATDPVHVYDANPNSIAAQSIVYTLSANPAVGTSPSCTSGGPIGVMLSGALLFNALDAGGRDAVAHEMQDTCQGHPQQTSEYHYHSLTSCIADPGAGHSNLLGYALDGFGIFGVRGEGGTVLTNADLDVCHGHTHAIPWDGATVTMYHYHATYAYPYTVGCFRGTAAKASALFAGVAKPHQHGSGHDDGHADHHHEADVDLRR